MAAAITSSTITTVAVFLPAGLRGRHRQPVLPALRPRRHVRPAGLAHRGAHGHPRAGLLVRGPHAHEARSGRRAASATIWQRLYTPVLVVALRSRLTKWATLGIAAVLFVVAMMLAPLLPTAFIDAGGENFLSVTVVAAAGRLDGRRPGEDARGRGHPHGRPRGHSWSSRRSRATPTPVPRRSRQPSPGRASNSAVITVRLADDVDLAAAREDIKLALAPLAQDGFEVAVSEQDFTGAGGGLADHRQRHRTRRHQGRQRRHRAPSSSTLDGVDNVASDAVAETPQVIVAVASRPRRAHRLARPPRSASRCAASWSASPSAATRSRTARSSRRSCASTTSGVDGVEGLRQMPISRQRRHPPLGELADVDQVDVRGQRHARRRLPGRHGLGRHHQSRTQARSPSRPALIDGLQGGRRDPRERDDHVRGCHGPDERGLRRPVLLDGRGHPGRLHRHGAGAGLAGDARSSSCSACRWRSSVPSRRCSSPATRWASAP